MSPLRAPLRLLSTSPPKLFHPRTKALQKARAALSPAPDTFDYLRDDLASTLIDRLQDISRPFPHALDLYCGSAHLFRAMQSLNNPPQIQKLWHADIHPAVLHRAQQYYDGNIAAADRQFLVSDDMVAGLEHDSLDLVMTAGGLHWVNDLPGLLKSVTNVLKPDGLFLGAMFGGETLHELRISMQLAEDELKHRLAPRVSPMVRLRDAAGLLTGAGLALTTADVDRIVVPYADMFAVMRHLKGMGESNALVKRELHYGRKVFERAARIYEDKFSTVDASGTKCVTATFEVVHMIGWAPAKSQPRAVQRGSAQFSLGDLPGATETVLPAGKKGES